MGKQRKLRITTVTYFIVRLRQQHILPVEKKKCPIQKHKTRISFCKLTPRLECVSIFHHPFIHLFMYRYIHLPIHLFIYLLFSKCVPIFWRYCQVFDKTTSLYIVNGLLILISFYIVALESHSVLFPRLFSLLYFSLSLSVSTPFFFFSRFTLLFSTGSFPVQKIFLRILAQLTLHNLEHFHGISPAN